MGLAILSFLAIFLLIGSAGLLIFFRAGMAQRLSAVIGSRADAGTGLGRSRFNRAGISLKSAVQPLDKLLPKSTQELSVARKRLVKAGFREDSDLRMLYGSKV